jgi:hypothetical protein
MAGFRMGLSCTTRWAAGRAYRHPFGHLRHHVLRMGHRPLFVDFRFGSASSK